ncbi:MAG TPA: hypothetical protein VF668_21375 [Pyrinomonadaceae bacterium]|jgi:predicted nucleic-acid-binding Zn-ribbon protein
MSDGRCAKCGSESVHVVDAAGLSIPVSAFSVARLGLYVCAACGHAELYVRDAEMLPKIAARYVSVAELKEAGS